MGWVAGRAAEEVWGGASSSHRGGPVARRRDEIINHSYQQRHGQVFKSNCTPPRLAASSRNMDIVQVVKPICTPPRLAATSRDMDIVQVVITNFTL